MKSDRIDLILADIVMPQMNGAQLIEQLQEAGNGFKVIYMSGYTFDSNDKHGILDEDVNYIQKPFTVNGLVRKVRDVFDQ